MALVLGVESSLCYIVRQSIGTQHLGEVGVERERLDTGGCWRGVIIPAGGMVEGSLGVQEVSPLHCVLMGAGTLVGSVPCKLRSQLFFQQITITQESHTSVLCSLKSKGMISGTPRQSVASI